MEIARLLPIGGQTGCTPFGGIMRLPRLNPQLRRFNHRIFPLRCQCGQDFRHAFARHIGTDSRYNALGIQCLSRRRKYGKCPGLC